MRLVRNTGLLLILLSLLPVYAVSNKWVDDKGQIHYGDRVPSQYLGKGREVLNDQGVVVKKYNKSKTREELSEEQRKKDLALEETKQKLIMERKKALRDRVLTDTFTTENDLIMARDRRIDAVTSQINLTASIIKDEEKKMESLKTRIKNIEASGRKVPENTTKSLVVVRRQLETYFQFIGNKNQERQDILNDFDRDLERFRELRAERNKIKPAE